MSKKNSTNKKVSDMKIAYILSQFPVLTETFIIREIREIRSRGIEVQVFSLKSPKSRVTSHKDVEDFCGNTHYIAYLFSTAVWRSIYYFLKTQPRCLLETITLIIQLNFKNPIVLIKSIAIIPKSMTIAKTIRDMGINKIHAHWATIPATVAWIVNRLNKTEFTFTTHAWDIFKADMMLEQKINSAAKVITISDFNKKYLITKFPDINPNKIVVIHIGIDLTKFKPYKRTPNKVFKILSIGRLVETKGFQFLLRACEILRKRNIQFCCKIIYVRDAYEKQFFELYHELNLSSSVELIPETPQETILDYYYSADCLALPCIVGKDGDRDGIPTVILEALATELPVISTKVSGIPEVIEDGKSGLLIEPEDTEKLAYAIEKLCYDTELRFRLGKNGRQIIKQKFEISANVDLLLENMLEYSNTRNLFTG